jgi:Outer membrane protein beta-barrel domain
MKPKVAFIFVAVILPGLARAQEAPKTELSLDYSYVHFQAIDYETPNYFFGQYWKLNGGGVALTYNFAQWIGIRGDLQYYPGEGRPVTVPPGNPFLPQGGSASVHGDLFTYMGGPQIGIRHGVFRPYAMGLVGGAHTGLYQNVAPALGFTNFTSTPPNFAFAADAGAGLDIAVNRRFSIRAFELSYLYTKFQDKSIDMTENQHSWRGDAGVVINMGLPNLVPPTMACAVQPSSVFPGEPVTATATATGLSTNKKNSVIYGWSGTGVTGNETTANVATASLDPGNYTVNATVKEGKKGKEGLKPWQTAQCSGNFTVKAFEPPTLSCSASPSTIRPGDSSTVTATGMSPQNRPLTYTYSATSGTINGNGTTATFASTGAPTGTVPITCNVSDDKGHTASANTSVDIVAPPPPPVPHAQALCPVSFANDKKRPMRVDNEGKACLDQVALSLQQQSDSKLVAVASSTSTEKTPPKHPKKGAVTDVAGQRGVNVKDYLVKEKGIDPSRINVATTATEGQQVEDYLVPSGANFSTDVSGTTPVDESTVKPQERKPLPERHHKH